MHFRLSEITGDGSDAEDNARRPALHGSADIFSTCYAGHVLCASVAEPPTSSGWSTLDSVDWSRHGLTVNDLSTVDEVAQRVARRFLTRQILAADDFGDLSMRFDQIPADQDARIRARLGVDFSGIAGSMTVDEALKVLLPRVRMRDFGSSSRPSPRGSFTDNFTRANENLEASANWTRNGGVAGVCAVRSNELAFLSTTETAYLAPDQSSTNHYCQTRVRTSVTNKFYFPCVNRITDINNFVGARARNSSSDEYDMFERSASTFTLLASTTAVVVTVDDILRLESVGNDHEFFVNGVSRGAGASTVNNTITRQGIGARQSTSNPAIDDYEIGAIAGGDLQPELLTRRTTSTLLRM